MVLNGGTDCCRQWHLKPVATQEQQAQARQEQGQEQEQGQGQGQAEQWQLVESVSAGGQCLTLRNSFPPSPAAPTTQRWSERLVALMRLLKSAGLNGMVLNDVNACYGDNGQVLETDSLTNVSRNLGPTMQRYGITPYIAACFGAPKVMANLSADPHSPQAQAWWGNKASELWQLWPSFGGFLVRHAPPPHCSCTVLCRWYEF